MIGQEMPSPKVADQATLSLCENSVGRPRLVETPLPFGPRNCGQSSARPVAATNVNRNAKMKVPVRRMGFLLREQFACEKPNLPPKRANGKLESRQRLLLGWARHQ